MRMSTTGPEPLTPTYVGDHVIYAVAGGNHVSVLLDRGDIASALDVIEVLAQPGGGPPPHRHAFAERHRRALGIEFWAGPIDRAPPRDPATSGREGFTLHGRL
jgi:hypothetical protein